MRRYRLTVDGAADDLTGFTHVRLVARRRGDDDALDPIEGSIVAPATSGWVDVDHADLTAASGNYLCDFEKVDAAGKVSSCEDPFLIPVRERAADIAY